MRFLERAGKPLGRGPNLNTGPLVFIPAYLVFAPSLVASGGRPGSFLTGVGFATVPTRFFADVRTGIPPKS